MKTTYSLSANSKHVKNDAHERFRAKIIHGRDMSDMEEELNTVRAKNLRSESVIKMKEEQITKYKKGLEKAKDILKDMVQSTQTKMKKLQDDVNTLQDTLKERETQLRSKTREVITLSQQLNADGTTSLSLLKQKEELERELEVYRNQSKLKADRFSGRQEEFVAQNTSLQTTNHRLTAEMANLQDKLQKKIRENQEQSSEIQILRDKIEDLRGLRAKDENSHLNVDARRKVSYEHLKNNFEAIQKQLKRSEQMMDDIEFFVGLKNTVDDYIENIHTPIVLANAVNDHRNYSLELKSKKTFEDIKKEKDLEKVVPLFQKLNRDVDEDCTNARRVLKEISSKTNVLKSDMKDNLCRLDKQSQQLVFLGGSLNTWEVQLQKILDRTNEIQIFGDYRDDVKLVDNNVLSRFTTVVPE